MPQDVASPPRYTVTLTDEAVAAAKRLLTKAGQTTAELGLRIKVSAGGCAGLRYQLYFDNLPADARPTVAVTAPDPELEDEGYFSADEDQASAAEHDEDAGYHSADEPQLDDQSRATGGQSTVSPAQLVDHNTVVWNGDLAVLIDTRSGPYVNGATIDFVETLDKYGFTIKNPNSQGGCACGDSFH